MTFFETTDKFGSQLYDDCSVVVGDIKVPGPTVEVWLSGYEDEVLLVSWRDENDGSVKFDEIGTIGM